MIVGGLLFAVGMLASFGLPVAVIGFSWQAIRRSQNALTPEQRAHRRHLRRTIAYPVLVGEFLLVGVGAVVGNLAWGGEGAITGALIAVGALTVLAIPVAIFIAARHPG